MRRRQRPILPVRSRRRRYRKMEAPRRWRHSPTSTTTPQPSPKRMGKTCLWRKTRMLRHLNRMLRPNSTETRPPPQRRKTMLAQIRVDGHSFADRECAGADAKRQHLISGTRPPLQLASDCGQPSTLAGPKKSLPARFLFHAPLARPLIEALPTVTDCEKAPNNTCGWNRR